MINQKMGIIKIKVPKLLDIEFETILKNNLIKNKNDLILDILLAVVKTHLSKEKNNAKKYNQLSPSEILIRYERRINGIVHLRRKLRTKYKK